MLRGRTEGLATPIAFIAISLFIVAVFALVLEEPLREGRADEVWMFLVALLLPLALAVWGILALFRFESLDATPDTIVHRRWW
ncbi:MAG: hypothetical protein KDA28_05210, partial [Phycisphaerales bacterium]|nr:hypothetical protein [Phycisphaerales bacterium]